MSSPTSAGEDPEHAALRRGRLEGMATAALAAGCVAFVNLLGAEKAMLAFVLAAVALAGLPRGPARVRAMAAVALAVLYAATIAAVLIVYHERLGQLIGLLRDLG